LISWTLKGKILHDRNKAETQWNLIKKLEIDMGKIPFKNWENKLKKSGIHLRKLSISQLWDLSYTTHDLIKNPRKLPGLPLPQKPAALIKMDINKIRGGTMSIRFPNLPKVVVVNQTPYYSYNSNRYNRIW